MKALIIIAAIALSANVSLADEQQLVWPTDQELGVEPGGTVKNGLQKLIDICRMRQTGQLPSDAEDDKFCVDFHRELMEGLNQ